MIVTKATYIRPNLIIKNIEIEQEFNYKYLGACVIENTDQGKEMRYRI